MVQMMQTGFTELAAIDKFYQCYMDVESLLAAYFCFNLEGQKEQGAS